MFVLGVFKVAELPSGVLYRWEADGSSVTAGFVLFDPATPAVRPCTEDGVVQGDLVISGSQFVVAGHDSSSDRLKVVRVAGAIISKYLHSGDVPETAHKYYA
ncbi:hypothetical protein [Catellatospora methionotrophica]|uniref:hypothetical protein n=1 Tax=Catellatospora methionotrophica TaxID=121620 RepID=UPI0033C349FF